MLHFCADSGHQNKKFSIADFCRNLDFPSKKVDYIDTSLGELAPPLPHFSIKMAFPQPSTYLPKVTKNQQRVDWFKAGVYHNVSPRALFTTLGPMIAMGSYQWNCFCSNPQSSKFCVSKLKVWWKKLSLCVMTRHHTGRSHLVLMEYLLFAQMKGEEARK